MTEGPFALTFALLGRINSTFLRELTVSLSVTAFVLGFILWFLRYVRVDRPESREEEG
jgi:hypothetical protein